MPGEDEHELLSIFSALPDTAAPAPTERASPRASTAWTPPDEEKISLSELSDLFGEKISATAVAGFEGPSEEKLRRTREERARLHAEVASMAVAPRAAPPADDPAVVQERLRRELLAEGERLEEKRHLSDASREEAVRRVKAQLGEWEDLRREREREIASDEPAAPVPDADRAAQPPEAPALRPPELRPPVLPSFALPAAPLLSVPAPVALPPLSTSPIAAPSLPDLPVLHAMPPVPPAPGPLPPPAAADGGPGAGFEPPAAAPAEPRRARKLNNMAQLELLLMLDEARKVISNVVTPLIGQKATHTMLTRTFEKSRTRHAKVFRNANWKADGNLREDGSLDKERVMRNLNDVPEPRRAEELLSALSDLIGLRLTAIEQGLARKVRAAVVCDITEQLERVAGTSRYEKPNVALFVEEILPPVTLD